MKKKFWIILAALLVIALGAAALILSGYTYVGGQFLKKGENTYDLREKSLSLADYEAICNAFPEANIYWRVRFQGNSIPEDTTDLTVTSLTDEDIRVLAYLPELKVLHAEGCTDYDALMQVIQDYPELKVFYTVVLGNTAVGSGDESVTLSDADAGTLLKMLAYLPALKEVALRGTLPETESLLSLAEHFPDIHFDFSVTLAGKSYPTNTDTLDLLTAAVTAGELDAVLPLFSPCTVTLPESFTENESKALAQRYPGHFFVFPYTIAGKVFSTDAEEVDISNTNVTIAEAEALVPYFKNLHRVFMADCGLPDDDLDALNRRYEDIRFVWNIKIAGVTYPTDIVYFYPWQQSISKAAPLDCSNLRYCPYLTTIDVGHFWVTDCSFLEYTPHIKYLIIAMTGCHDITPVGTLKELEYLEVFEMIVDDYSPLLGCTALRDLNVGTTDADPAPLFKMTWLDNLYMYCGENNLRSHGYDPQALVDALPNTNVVFDLIRNCGQEWRYLPRYYIMRDILNTGYLNQYSARSYWGNEDMDEILSCKLNPDKFAGDVLAQIISRRKANGEYIPGIKNSGPKPKEVLHGTP